MLATAAVFLLAGPASAVDVEPKALVLSPADVPAGFRLDPDESGVRTNEREGRDNPEARKLFSRWRRVTGYQAAYARRGSEIESRVDVLRSASGARSLFRWVDEEMMKAGVLGLKRARAGIGAESRVYSGGTPVGFTLVAWRYGRVFAGIVSIGVPRDRVLALARVQQRRIAAALR